MINQSRKKKSPVNNLSNTEVLTGYEVSSPEECERICDIIVYDIPNTWSAEKITAELKLWGNPIKLSIKRQHKYQTLRVKIALFSFSLPQFNNNWATDFQCDGFLQNDRKPTTYLCELGAKSFKIIQTGKGKRKLVGYFEKWKAIRKVLDNHQVLSSKGIRLPWCQYSKWARISLVLKAIISCWVHVAKTMKAVFNKEFMLNSYEELQVSKTNCKNNRPGFIKTSNFDQLFLNWYITEDKYLIEKQIQNNDLVQIQLKKNGILCDFITIYEEDHEEFYAAIIKGIFQYKGNNSRLV
ncbi:hypothetical protein RhiirA4_481992 [Rhizophagus irregularis]|uniref:Uncharacterized protein n=1 Tax=Rhizophagus irregularis TaxID=588596 RepID=A0A2I1HKD0_9GLOM|nr:hypothetical protein RhiirA4_481992 [Rhizophagus irregularis]